MKKIAIITFVIFMLALSAAEAKNAKKGNRFVRLPKGEWWKLAEVKDSLPLSKQEQTKIKQLYETSKNKERNYQKTRRNALKDLKAVFSLKSFSEALFNKKLDKFTIANSNLLAERYRIMLEVHKLLGAERFQKLSQMKTRQQKMNPKGPKKPPQLNMKMKDKIKAKSKSK